MVRAKAFLGSVLAAAAIVQVPGAAAATAHRDLSYDIDSPPSPSPADQNALDLYVPDGVGPGASRPVVVYVHGGGWALGDKENKIADKVSLFTGAGYVFASLNYRLSPTDFDPANPDHNRVMFPDQPHDVGEAIGWLDRHVADFGGNPRDLLLIGHSAGAQLVSLVSTDPRYIGRYGVPPWHLIGTISLDTDAFEIPTRIAELAPRGRTLFYNAFGTPDENAASGAWVAASPIHWADPGDPRFLLVTQASNPGRIAENRAMATVLGEDPATSVLLAPYDHQGINDAVGSSADSAGETGAIMSFVADRLAAAKPPRTRLRRRPPKVIHTRRRKIRVTFAFAADQSGASFQCRRDGGAFERCRSPRSFKVRHGKHRFSVRALSTSGRPGPIRTHRFRVLRKRPR